MFFILILFLFIFFLGTIGFSDDLETVCDNLLNRLDFLTNISPENYSGDDYEFSRFKNETVGQGNAAYGEKSYTWISNYSYSCFSCNIQIS